jgi:dTDP-4-dehydrorhamnose reductase
VNGTRAILVAGRTGQLARSLLDVAAEREVPIMAIGRPDLDLEQPAKIERVLDAAKPSAIINAGAYTAVDQAEFEPERVLTINSEGPARLAATAARLRIPFIHISTDYVFDGRKASPYREHDGPSPLNAYGRSKLEGERAVCNAYPAALVLRTSWTYSAHGHNFVRTMLRLAETREVVRVVDDQHGAPTATGDLAHAILDILAQYDRDSLAARAGIYHLAATGEASWHDFAAAIFAGWTRRGGRVPILERIRTADYPTPARRPANCRLDCTKIERVFGVRLPLWQLSLESCLDRIAAENSSREAPEQASTSLDA